MNRIGYRLPHDWCSQAFDISSVTGADDQESLAELPPRDGVVPQRPSVAAI
jgi:hypothetical protein